MTQDSSEQPLYRTLKAMFQQEKGKAGQGLPKGISEGEGQEGARARARRILQELIQRQQDSQGKGVEKRESS